jgi:hypothetical protein
VQVFVIQQRTVSLWDETGGGSQLRDVRGAGDMLGIERYTGARSCLHTARAETDFVLYALPADDFESCVLKCPHVVQYVEAEGRSTPTTNPPTATAVCSMRFCTTSWDGDPWSPAGWRTRSPMAPGVCSPRGPKRSPWWTRKVVR